MRWVPIFGTDTGSEGGAGSPPQVLTAATVNTDLNLQGRRHASSRGSVPLSGGIEPGPAWGHAQPSLLLSARDKSSRLTCCQNLGQSFGLLLCDASLSDGRQVLPRFPRLGAN